MTPAVLSLAPPRPRTALRAACELAAGVVLALSVALAWVGAFLSTYPTGWWKDSPPAALTCENCGETHPMADVLDPTTTCGCLEVRR